jgi:hypothetical protein
MAPPTLLSGPIASNGTPAPASSSRSRPQARRKPNDDATYFAAAGIKRNAGDKVDGAPRVKRKRVDTSGLGTTASSSGRRTDRDRVLLHDGDVKMSLVNDDWNTTAPMILTSSHQVEFADMPTSTLYRYLTQFDLIPSVYPSPLKADDPPPPPSLDHPVRQISRAPSPSAVTPANRPRRESKEQGKRRSSRLLEEEVQSRTPILADVADVHGALAGIADRHFRAHTVREVDTLATFMSRISGEKGRHEHH